MLTAMGRIIEILQMDQLGWIKEWKIIFLVQMTCQRGKAIKMLLLIQMFPAVCSINLLRLVAWWIQQIQGVDMVIEAVFRIHRPNLAIQMVEINQIWIIERHRPWESN